MQIPYSIWNWLSSSFNLFAAHAREQLIAVACTWQSIYLCLSAHSAYLVQSSLRENEPNSICDLQMQKKEKESEARFLVFSMGCHCCGTTDTVWWADER